MILGTAYHRYVNQTSNTMGKYNNVTDKITLTKTHTYSQRTWVLLCEVRQVDIGKVNEQHPYGLFGGVQKPERGGEGSVRGRETW